MLNCTNDYIYKIKVGNFVYIGQSESDGLKRIDSHIRNAYYHAKENLARGADMENDIEAIYKKMASKRLDEIEITIYKEPNFGLADFDKRYTEFCANWVPIGRRTTINEDYKDAKSRIDFAEIYHILYNEEYGDANVTNKEMGGKISGYAFNNINHLPDDIYSKEAKKTKAVMKTDTPRQAINIFAQDPNLMAEVNETVREVYDIIFSSEWADRREELFDFCIFHLGDAVSGKQWRSENAKVTWPQFAKQIIFEKLKEMDKSKRRKNAEKFTTAFIESRTIIMGDILAAKFKAKGIKVIKGRSDIEHLLDFDNLIKYITDAISNITSAIIINDPDNIRNKLVKAQLTGFEPRNFTGVWRVNRPKTIKGGDWLFKNPTAPVGEPIGRDYMVKRSVLMFDYLFKKTPTVELYNLMDNTNGFRNERTSAKKAGHRVMREVQMSATGLPLEPGTNFALTKSAAAISHSDWLSARMRQIYMRYAPGYADSWLEFYRPMVSYWRRNKRKLDIFELYTDENDNSYWIRDLTTVDGVDVKIGYAAGDNFIPSADYSDIIIY